MESSQWDTGVSHATSCLAQCGITDIVVSRNIFKTGYLPDIYPDKGILSGLHSAMFHKPNHNLLCVTPDMPGLTYELLRWILASGRVAKSCCHYRHHYLPLYIHNDCVLRETLELKLIDEKTILPNNLTILGCQELVAPYPSQLVRIST
ncbi:NTP transferase domain-containing protein [Neptunicella sp.]|uniref:NTP transferase domain-containing protein n=1 Tax=Neptunicella sp. TaxID=2125986 RepID=UPI003F6938C0